MLLSLDFGVRYRSLNLCRLCLLNFDSKENICKKGEMFIYRKQRLVDAIESVGGLIKHQIGSPK